MKTNLELWTNYEVQVLSADGAQTNAAIGPAISATQRFEVVDLMYAASNANTVDTAIRIGFAAATLPAAGTPASPATGILASHLKCPAGGGGPGVDGIGARDQELRLTCGAPTTGGITITYRGRIIAAAI